MADALAEFLRDYHAGRLVFFAGAGASFDSQAPMPLEVLNASGRCFLPPRAVSEILPKPKTEAGPFAGLQPEVFYEHLFNLTGDEEALFLWRVLSPAWRQARKSPLSPNPNHLALARYADRTGIPIFTTNFDDLFEAAADALGLEKEVITPTLTTCRTLAELRHTPPRPGCVTIVKLHGTIVFEGREVLSSLRSTMQGISIADENALAVLQQYRQGRTMAFLGYSGCDIDLFPSFQKANLSPAPYWFNPVGDDITNDRIDRLQAREIAKAPSKVFAELQPDDGPSHHGVAVPSPVLLKALEAEQTLRLTAGQKQLLLGMCRASLGRNAAAASSLTDLVADHGLPAGSRERILALLQLARVQDALSHYDDSITTADWARRAIREARAAGQIDRAEADQFDVRARYHRSMAHQQSIGPSLRYGDPRTDFTASAIRVMAPKLLAGLWVQLRFWILGLRQSLRRPKVITGAAAAAQTRARHAMNDHWLLLLARISGAAEGRVMRMLPPLRSVMKALFAGLSGNALKDGDYFVYAGAEKHLRRLDGQPTSDTYQMLRDPLNYALVLRDNAAFKLEAGDPEGAAKLFAAARDAALTCDSAATVIKAVLGLVACGLDTQADRQRLSDALATIQGDGYRTFEALTRVRLTLPPTAPVASAIQDSSTR